jgi:ketosteroid isomerase-like protein
MTTELMDVTRAIRESDDRFEHNVQSRSASQLVEMFYAQEAVVMPPNQPMASGRVEIAKFWQTMFDAGLRGAALRIVRVDVSGDLASEIGEYSLTISPDGADLVQAQGKYLVVHHRQADGTWKATADMFSSDTPA